MAAEAGARVPDDGKDPWADPTDRKLLGIVAIWLGGVAAGLPLTAALIAAVVLWWVLPGSVGLWIGGALAAVALVLIAVPAWRDLAGLARQKGLEGLTPADTLAVAGRRWGAVRRWKKE